VKNIERLHGFKIESLWLNGAKEKDLEKILTIVNPKYLNLYNVLAKDLKSLESLLSTETIILEWNTKSDALWDIGKNVSLRNLEIIDFSKLYNIQEISTAKQIEKLVISSGMEKPLKLKSLQPLENLINLKILSLWNLKVEDDSLKPIASLKNLDRLEISNQFETKEYAWLATKLTRTESKMFNAINPCRITDANQQIVLDTMVTGRRKSFLLSTKDQTKIEKHIRDFEKLKREFAKHSST
jgi:hypothetical protein